MSPLTGLELNRMEAVAEAHYPDRVEVWRRTLASDAKGGRSETFARVLSLRVRLAPYTTVAVTDEFVLKSLFPFFAAYFAELGVRLEVLRGADQRTLKRGIEEAKDVSRNLPKSHWVFA